MPSIVTGSFLGPFAQAIYQRLNSDATLNALVTGVFTSLPRSTEIAFPYVVVSGTERGGKGYHGGAMQKEGGRALQTVDVWGTLNDRTEVEAIQSRITMLLQRYPLTVAGFTLIQGSVDCEDERRFEDKDPELPQQGSLFHGVQQWTAWLEEQ